MTVPFHGVEGKERVTCNVEREKFFRDILNEY